MQQHIKKHSGVQEEQGTSSSATRQESHESAAEAAAVHDSDRTAVVTNVDQIPPVHVIIADSPNNEDVIIKVSDEGGGIPRSKLNQIFSYLYTTAENNVQEQVLLHKPTTNNQNNGSTDVASAAAALSKSPILAGLGFGLPMSRAYAQYFGGALDIISLEGYGTDGMYCIVWNTPLWLRL
ncbi:MAG: hypothetical protein SGARI_003003 [Bacillariaceae sp.]